MKSLEAVKAVFAHIQDEPVVHATGYISRFGQAAKDRPENFYMIGSMGMTSSIALGIALAKPGRKIVALDGDGAVLMNLGQLATIGALKPENFIHIVIDNASYESTGGQTSHTQTVKLEDIAKSAGYRYTKRVRTRWGLDRVMKKALTAKGPVFILIRTSSETAAPPPRVLATPEEITQNFSKSLR